MTRELGMAGYDPTRTANAWITTAAANSVSFSQDLNGNGSTADSNETITYSLYTGDDGIQRLGRSTSGGVPQPIVDNVQSLTFAYYDANNNVTATLANIRSVQINLQVRTAKPDPLYGLNGGYRTYALHATVVPRNLAAAWN
ncbi:MAG: hypothetical protein PHY31_05990, partial [Smithellaceae bacterium]|nr:hypothetical protein [Smithellaceae bacterium]